MENHSEEKNDPKNSSIYIHEEWKSSCMIIKITIIEVVVVAAAAVAVAVAVAVVVAVVAVVVVAVVVVVGLVQSSILFILNQNLLPKKH